MGTKLQRSPDGDGSEGYDSRTRDADRRDQASPETTTLLGGASLTDQMSLHERWTRHDAGNIQRAAALPTSLLAISAR
jgi:hypothetical protein